MDYLSRRAQGGLRLSRPGRPAAAGGAALHVIIMDVMMPRPTACAPSSWLRSTASPPRALSHRPRQPWTTSWRFQESGATTTWSPFAMEELEVRFAGLAPRGPCSDMGSAGVRRAGGGSGAGPRYPPKVELSSARSFQILATLYWSRRAPSW